MRLRCWARSGTTGELCNQESGHKGPMSPHLAPPDAQDSMLIWPDSDCAPNANSTGRETAALRILEVAHEIDRLNFTHGCPADDEMRAMASRLFFNGNRAASSDLRQLEWRSANTSDRAYVALLDMAADILRLFVNR